MFKTVSAALFAVSVLAAPALAAPYGSEHGPMFREASYNATVLNANAHWRRHHRPHRWHYFHHRHPWYHYRHHRHHDHYRHHYWR